MAGADDLFLGTNDLLNFNNSVQQNNTFGLVGKSLGAWQPDMSTWSPVTQGVTSFGKAFLSGLLGNYARQNASDQLSKVVTALPQLRTDPYSVAVPDGVDADAFNVLKGSAILKNDALNTQRQNALSDLMQKVGIAGLTKKAEIMGEAQGKEAIYGDLKNDPNSPQYKVEKDKLDTLDTLRDKFNKLPEVTAFSQVQRAASAMSGALKDKGGPSDLELVRYSIQMIEPGMAVREGEQNAVLKSGSIPDQWKGALNKSLENGTELSDTIREGLKRLASRAYEAQKTSYDKALTYHQGLAEGRNLLQPGSSISYLGNAPDSTEVFGSAQTTLDPKSFAQKALAQGLTKEQARAAWAAHSGGQ